MTVKELIAALQGMDPNAQVVAPFSPNAADINVEEVGGVIVRERAPFAMAAEIVRSYSVRAVRSETEEP